MLTLIHISDLHVGKGGFLTATEGHSEPARADLAGLIAAEPELEDAVLVFTGDLTAEGKKEEFDRGRKILEEFRPPTHEPDRLLIYAISGNHDRWNDGSPWLALIGFPPRPKYLQPQQHTGVKMFLPTPRQDRLEVVSEGLCLEVFAINSDSEIFYGDRADKWGALFACGRCVAEAEDLYAQNEKAAETQSLRLALLLIHHSPCFRSALGGIWQMVQTRFEESPTPKELEPGSRAALRSLLASADAAIVLSGHIHSPAILNIAEFEEFTGCCGFEARCGSTLQQGRAGPLDKEIEQYANEIVEPMLVGLPMAYRHLMSDVMRLHVAQMVRPSNAHGGRCFFVHRLLPSPDGWLWVVDLLGHTEDGFSPLGRPWTSGNPRFASPPYREKRHGFPRVFRIEPRRGP